MAAVVDDLRSLDPVSYIQTLGLKPEDSYGFMPLELKETGPLVYVYRDSPEYEKARAAMPAPTESRSIPMQAGPGGQSMFMVEGDRSMDMSQLIQQSVQMAQSWGAQGATAAPAEPDLDKLERIQKLKEEGAIDQKEFDRLKQEAGFGDGAAGPASKADGKAAPIVAQRLYPTLHVRARKRQLNKFMPDYHRALGLRPEDVYGVFPRETTLVSASGPDSGNLDQWDDYWIVYRDRPEYEAGRAAWAKEMNKRGKWPEPMISPGVCEAPELGADESEVEVREEKLPKKADDLGQSLLGMIEECGYASEDSFGFTPSYSGFEIYLAWRRS